MWTPNFLQSHLVKAFFSATHRRAFGVLTGDTKDAKASDGAGVVHPVAPCSLPDVSRSPRSVHSVRHFVCGVDAPPLNQFMTLPRRFLASRLATSVDSSPNTNSSSDTGVRSRHRAATTSDNLLNDEDEGWHVPDHFVLPHMVHFQDVAAAPTHQSQEIDLTLSSDEEEADGDVIEILEPTEGDPQPTPLRRKRRRPGADALLVPKRQRMTDMMRSAESTNVSIHNSEVVEEFKRRLKCSICLDVLEDMTSTLCGHIFCAACIHQAIRANGKCPLCQRHLHLKDTHRLFF